MNELKYIKLAHYSGKVLMDYFDTKQFSELGDNYQLLFDPGFWYYRLKNEYKLISKDTVSLNTISKDTALKDTVSNLSTAYNTYKYISIINKLLDHYKKYPTEYNYAKARDILIKYLDSSVNYSLLTVFYYLITKYGAPIIAQNGSIIIKAIKNTSTGWSPMIVIEALIESNRLSIYMRSYNISFNLINTLLDMGRYDVLTYIIKNDKRKDIGKSQSYRYLLYNSIIKTPECKYIFVGFLLKNIHYSPVALYGVIRDISTTTSDVDDRCLSKLLNELYSTNQGMEIAIYILYDNIYKQMPGLIYSSLLFHPKMQSNTDEYIELLKLSAKYETFNRYTIKGLYIEGDIDKGFLPFSLDLINDLINIAESSQNYGLSKRLITIIEDRGI